MMVNFCIGCWNSLRMVPPPLKVIMMVASNLAGTPSIMINLKAVDSISRVKG